MHAITPQGFDVLLVILVSLLVKHFAADYLLQTKYMLRKANKKGWLLPLLTHAAVHGTLTCLVLLPLVGSKAFMFALMDLVIHFGVDLWKSRTNRYHAFDKRFWIAHGLDQLAHELTYLMIAFLAMASCPAVAAL